MLSDVAAFYNLTFDCCDSVDDWLTCFYLSIYAEENESSLFLNLFVLNSTVWAHYGDLVLFIFALLQLQPKYILLFTPSLSILPQLWGTLPKGRRYLSRDVPSVTLWQRRGATRWDPTCGVCLVGRRDKRKATHIHRLTLKKVGIWCYNYINE